MWKETVGIANEIRKGLDFVKKQVGDVVGSSTTSFAPSAPSSPTGGLFVWYTLKAAPVDVTAPFIGMSDTDDTEEVAYHVTTSGGSTNVSVQDAISAFPIRFGDKGIFFRFKTADPEFGHVWIDSSSIPPMDPSPTFERRIHMQVIVCPTRGGQAKAPAGAADECSTAPSSVHIGVKTLSSGARPDREMLVKQRLAMEAEKVRIAREFVQKNAADDTQRRASKLEAQNELGAVLDAWAFADAGNAKFKDVRSLLASMDTVLWRDSGWSPVPMGELMMNEAVVKKTYRKAIIMCHPDRHQQAPAEQQYRADRIFSAVNEAYKLFNA